MKELDLAKTFNPSNIDDKSLMELQNQVSLAASLDFNEKTLRFRKLSKKHRSNAAKDDNAIAQLQLAVCFSILADFSEQGWAVQHNGGLIEVISESLMPSKETTVSQIKQRIRKGFQTASNRQLAEYSVQNFILGMETERKFDDKKVSVLSLIDSGSNLAGIADDVRHLNEADRLEELSNKFKPEIVECKGDERCPYTGIRLQDIWRYFRHTWSLEYKLLPGRTLRLLVRNAAQQNHPIIGIALLASPTANLKSRDQWVGWTMEELTDGLLKEKWQANSVARELLGAIDQSIDEIRTDDIISRRDLRNPKPNCIFQLEQIVAKAQLDRKRDLTNPNGDELVDIRGLKKEKLKNADWKRLSETALFKKKRAEQLVPLLQARSTMKAYGFDNEPGTALYKALLATDGKIAIKVALNEIKKRRLSSEVADLAVCGSVAPYNELLGGKLVTALMASNDVREIYKRRYGSQVSEIASQIAGKKVIKSADLKLLTTTSLYGVGSSQYNRLRLKKKENPNLDSDLCWIELADSEGFTVTHISDETVDTIRQLSFDFYGRRRINSVFGEGSSPRTRQILEGLNILGVRTSTKSKNSLLTQKNFKKVYGCEIYPGAKTDTLGFSSMGQKDLANTADDIAQAWISRWLSQRILREETLINLSKLNSISVSNSLRNRISDQTLEVEAQISPPQMAH